MLDNLSIQQMESRMGIEFPAKLKDVLEKYHQHEASDIQPGFWHCFDLPFTMVCGNQDLADLVLEHLSPMVNDIIIPLNLAVVKKPKVGYTKESK